MNPNTGTNHRTADPRTVAQLQSRLESLLGAQECQDECFSSSAVRAVGELAASLLATGKLEECLSASFSAWVRQHGGGAVTVPWWPTMLPGTADPALLEAAHRILGRVGGELRFDVASAMRGALLLRLGRASEAATALRAAIVRDARAPERHVELVIALAQIGDHDGALRALAGLRAQFAQASRGGDERWRRAIETCAAAVGEPT